MILNTRIENFAGIKEFNTSFSRKHVYDGSMMNQVLKDENGYYSMTPTFLAKNAAGKTSFIKAITFALSFASKKGYKRNLQIYINNIRSRKQRLKMNSFDSTDEINVHGLDLKFYGKEVISDLFHEISHIGAKALTVEILLTRGRKLKIELDNESFFITMNDTTINVLEDIYNLEAQMMAMSPSDIRRNGLNYNKILDKYVFYNNINSASIFRDTRSVTEISEINIKHKASIWINNLVDTFGYEATKTLLKKMDQNISNIKHDIENKDLEIFVNDSDIPISPRNLSFGTQKVLEILYKSIPLFENGGIILIDEIENGLHLSLIKMIISFFEDSNINKGKAQIFMTTHNPLLIEREIIVPTNVYMYENSNFINSKEIKISGKRSYDLVKMIKSKNYYNDLFWAQEDKEIKSTLSNISINQIVNQFSEGVKWLRLT